MVRDWDWQESEDAPPVKVPADILGVYYSDIIPVLVNGVQELNGKLELLEPAAVSSLQETIQRQQAEIDALKTALQSVLNNQKQFESDLQLCCFDEAGSRTSNTTEPQADHPALGLNVPNPFRESTLIHFYLPANAGQALIRVSNMEGRPLKDLNIEGRHGHGQVEFHTSGLASGTYLYSLFVDGGLVATKKMMLLK